MVLRIKELPLTVANQIAAGEVIERPASVVKELLENAYDADASQITVDIAHGGLNQIKVSDNGAGILAEDLPLTIKAHATSKIQDIDDLYSIASMGFRGEALASIASVARICISSKTKEQKDAMRLQAEDGNVRLSACARNKGTTIEVLDLFYNLPVRKKFLKSERLEFLAIEAVVRRFAMSAPHIALCFKHNGKTVLTLPAAGNRQSQYQRMTRLFGHHFAKDALYLEVERSGMRLEGWLSGHQYQRSQSDRQWIYINRRMVKDKLILHAIKQVYEGILHPGRFPSCLLYFHLPSEEVDVNVHPAKHEVRFQQPRLVHDFFVSQLTQALTCAEDNPWKGKEEIKTAANVAERQEQLYQPLLNAQSVLPPHLPADGSPWIILNKRFALCFHQARACLVDVKKLQQQYLHLQLKAQTRPLAARGLLVPVSFQVSTETYALLEKKLETMKALGIHVQLGKGQQIIVQALPLLMPQFDIGRLMANLSEVCLADMERFLFTLSTCQSFNAQELTVEENERLYRFFLQLQEPAWAELNLCKYLQEEHCQVLFDD